MFRTRYTVAWIVTVLLLTGCGQSSSSTSQSDTVALQVPRGFSRTLVIERDGHFYEFGPFVGYYFRPERPNDLSRVRFVCFNERGFYASDMPDNARLYDGVAVLTKLPEISDAVPSEGERIRPVFFEEAPMLWLDTRPAPQDEFLHFHSLHDGRGTSWFGYWLRHDAVAAFTYDMGGRVDSTSPLYHEVTPGPDRSFARIVEFDFGEQ